MLVARKKPQPPPAARTISLPAPVGGLNARESLATMPPNDAVILENFFPGTTSVDLRGGYEKWSTGYPAAVESLMTYNGPTTSKLFSASGTAIYDATTKGAVGAAAVSGLSNARWQHANMGTPGGQFLVCVNGADSPQAFTGTAWQKYASVSAQTISSITRSGTTATLMTSAAHGLETGNWVTVVGATPAGFNGNYQVTVPATPAAQTISSITRVTTTATLTTAAAHGLVTGNIVTISGATPAGFNGTYAVTVTSATTFTYTMSADPGGNATVVGSYVVVQNTFTYVMAADPGGNATVVGTYVVAPTITGVDPKKLIQVNQYANRLFFVEKDSQRVWYLPVNTIGGAASSLDFGPLFSLGGYLMAMATWTIDNAAGMVEYAVFISSEGEIVIYSGTDPSTASNWVKAGRFRMGRPIGRRCYARVGSELVMITEDGFVPLSQALLTDRSQMQTAISDKIVNLVVHDVAAYGANFGWEVTLHPTGMKLVFNVPQNEKKVQYQYVMNTTTGAWCKFTGWGANTFELLGKDLYFGSNLGKGANSAFVARCDVGYSDDGAYIFGEAKSAFQYFGAIGQQKQVTMARPFFQTTGNMRIAIAVDMDFKDNRPEEMPSFTGTQGTKWDTEPWNTFPWGSNGEVKKDWQGVTGVGDAAAFHMRVVNNKTAIKWQAVQYVYRLGKIL